MKLYTRLTLIFIMITIASCVAAPIIKILLDNTVGKVTFVADMVNYENGQYDFGKVMRRILMLVAIIIFLIYRKPLKIGAFMLPCIKIRTGVARQFLFGFSIALASIIIYYLIALLLGAWAVYVDDKATSILPNMAKCLLIGCIVAYIEEIFFRGYILQSLIEEMALPIAIIVSSLLYSILHFFNTEVYVTTGFKLFVGFTTMIQFIKPVFLEFIENLPTVIGLFLVGVILSYAFVLSKTLYLSIGLHSGWIFMMKIDSIFLARTVNEKRWLFGGNHLETGILIWIILIIIFLVIKKAYNKTETTKKSFSPTWSKK